jgi:M3 family oligoendopeptidase
MQVLAQLRKSLGIDKDFYCKEIDYYDEAEPILENLVSDFYRVLTTSKFEESLRNKYGNKLFDLANMKTKCVSDKILEELQEEKRLVTEYVNLCESIKTAYEGKEYGLWDFDPLICSQDRKTRKNAYEAQTELYMKHEEEMQKLFDRFVKLRHKMALKMGYKNFVEMGYARMNRIGYDKEMVANFRNQVLEYVVPLNTELIKRQGNRLGAAPTKYYDETIFFMDGNSKVKGDYKFVIDKIQKVYEELSSETDEFFKYITSRKLIDIEDRKNKEEGGFCEYMPTYKAPFIYTKYNGTIENFNEVVHEVGHAFQNYLCTGYDIPEYIMVTEDIAEIHSMSMEFLIEPWLEEFFGEGADRYKFSHMCSALSLLAYIAAVDEFQHAIYEKPEATFEERNSMWRYIEKKYLPYRNYEGNDYLEKGAYWLRQSHIFWGPFYYIDYGLAQVVAFDFWSKAKVSGEEAWKDYVNLCKAGGTLSFTEILKVGNVRNIFEPGSIEAVINDIEEWILNVEKSCILFS